MALDEAQPDSNPEGSVALLPEPFVVNAQAVELARRSSQSRPPPHLRRPEPRRSSARTAAARPAIRPPPRPLPRRSPPDQAALNRGSDRDLPPQSPTRSVKVAASCASLHLSDLHRAGATETLKAIWNGPQAALRKLPEAEQRFDFIVVSGDLAGAARDAEYQELHEFAVTSLLPLLREPDARTRIVFVPGNHDVDWSAELGRPLQIADLLQKPGGSEQLAALLRRYRDDPARSGVRQVIQQIRPHRVDRPRRRPPIRPLRQRPALPL